MKYDDLSTRMKENYENRFRYFVPRRTYTIIRLDGKSFHTYTAKLKKPFDNDLMEDIDKAIESMLLQIQGVVFAYTQSDEISILLTDFEKPVTSAWFDGNIQKIASVSASILTAEFNKLRINRYRDDWNANKPTGVYPGNETLAYFDSRVFCIPDRTEVMNYFRWRQQDCTRNSLSMVAQSFFTHMELQGKSNSDKHDMLHKIGVNWATDYTDGEKNGRVTRRIITKEEYHLDNLCNEIKLTDSKPVDPIMRTHWVTNGAWEFTKDEGKLLNMIPKYE